MTDATMRVQELEPGVFLLDQNFQGLPGIIGSYLLWDGEEAALIETGPSSTTPTLLAAVEAAGVPPGQIRHLLLTHIHLDHAGAAGSLAQRLPDARVYVHEVGAPHLADPSRLLRSATRIYGDEMESLWGEVLPVPEERLEVIGDGAVLEVAGRRLVALDTPGHAFHHLAYHDQAGATIYTGDVAGVRLNGAAYVRPPTPPPELDLELWRASIARLRELRPERLRLTHFGEFVDVGWHLDDVASRLAFWGGWVAGRLPAQSDQDALTAELEAIGDREIQRAGGDDELVDAYEVATNYRMTVGGYLRYFDKKPV